MAIPDLNPNLVEEWRRRRLEPEPNLPPPTEPVIAYPPEMAPPMTPAPQMGPPQAGYRRPDLPVRPYPDVGPTWDLRRTTAQDFALAPERRQELFDTGIRYRPYEYDEEWLGGPQGLYHPPTGQAVHSFLTGKDRPQLEVQGEPRGKAPGILAHELGHQWYFEKMPPEQRAQWERDWRDLTPPDTQRHIDTAYDWFYPHKASEGMSYMLDRGGENIPDEIRQTYMQGFFDEDEIQRRVAEQGNSKADALNRLFPDTGPQMQPPETPRLDERIEADIERLQELEQPLREEEARELIDMERWRRLRQDMTTRMWEQGFR